MRASHPALAAAGTALSASKPGVLAAAGAEGRVILAGVRQFLLAYSGVFALAALTAAVVAGLIATDRLVITPAGRIVFQAVHRALSLAAVGFLASHIVLEVLAHRSRAVDAVVPFLASGRTLYLGAGTLASDLVLLIVITGVARRRFAAHWTVTWRVVHVTAYLGWPLAIVHGLLGGRTAKPYVAWSYGACVAVVALALVIRVVATTRSRTDAAPHPVPEQTVLPTDTIAARQPGAWLPVPPPQHRALTGEIHYGTIQYGIEGDGMPPGTGTP